MNHKFLYMSSRWLYPIELRPEHQSLAAEQPQAGHISWPMDSECQAFEWQPAQWCIDGNGASSPVTLRFHPKGNMTLAQTTTYEQVFDLGATLWGEDPLRTWGRIYRCLQGRNEAQFLLRIQ